VTALEDTLRSRAKIILDMKLYDRRSYTIRGC